MIEIVVLQNRFQGYSKEARRVIRELIRFLKLSRVHLDVYILGDAFLRQKGRKILEFSRRIHARRAEKNSFNVLSFPAVRFPGPKVRVRPLGEIYINPDYIRRRGENFSRLLIHGFLHLLGYDHKRKDDRMGMEKIERKLWRNISSPESTSAVRMLKRRSPR